MTDGLRVRASSLSDVGRARELNEDREYAGAKLFAVADGLGGHMAGEVASQIAIETIGALEQRLDAAIEPSVLADAVREANREVFERAQHRSEERGMGTTITTVLLDNGTAHIAHVGDSRLYLLRGNTIRQVTNDHTLVARMVAEGKLTQRQAETHPQRSILTRALGAGADVEVETQELKLAGGDRLLLCSDGLTAVLADEDLRELVEAHTDLDEACRTLIDEANARGGPDNVTVVLVAVDGPRPRPIVEPTQGIATATPTAPAAAKKPRRRIPVRAIAWLLIVAAVAVGGSIGVRAWINRSWYVGLDGDKVAIYQGLPTDALGGRLNRVAEKTTITTKQVAPFYLPRLHEGIRAKDLSEARAIVAKIPTPVPSPTPVGTPT